MPTTTLVSAADAKYYRCLLQLARSVERHGTAESLRCIAYDLGLDAAQRAQLARRFPRWQLRRFDFSGLPAHVAIRERARNSNAWKPLVIDQVVAEHGAAPVVWLDAATVLLAPLDAVVAHARSTGLYTPFGGASSLAELTDPRVLAHLGVSAELGRERQRASGVFACDPAHPVARALVSEWARLALDPLAIAPPGATLATHRFDQSLLNVLLHTRARAGGIALTDDAIDVSSAHPSPLYRTRNKVHRRVPLALDPAVRAFFAARRAVDVALLRARG